MNKKIFTIVVLILMILILPSCDSLHNIEMKLGIRNEGFEYFKSGKVNKVIIQSKRDKNFKFIITDKEVIGELYDILSNGKKVEEKSKLDPDYVIEIYEKGKEVRRFNYIAGLDKNDNGNLYSDEEVYIISNRLDNDLIRNFFNIRKPINFYSVYYGSIISILENYLSNNSNDSVSINIEKDLEMAKFILSTDIVEFKHYVKDNFKNVFVNSEKNADVLMNIETEGYKSDIFKMKAEIIKNDKTIKKYYIICKYNNIKWDKQISEDDKPEEF